MLFSLSQMTSVKEEYTIVSSSGEEYQYVIEKIHRIPVLNAKHERWNSSLDSNRYELMIHDNVMSTLNS